MTELPPLVGEHHVCERCGLAYDRLSVLEAVGLASDGIEALVALVEGAPEEDLRRSAAGTWTAVEYACHVRDVLVTYAVRVHRGLLEERPPVDPMYGDWRAARFGYSAAPLADVVREIRCGWRGFAAEVAAVPDAAWDREITRRPDEVRTLRWLLRQAAHEVMHHRDDVRGLLGGQPV